MAQSLCCVVFAGHYLVSFKQTDELAVLFQHLVFEMKINGFFLIVDYIYLCSTNMHTLYKKTQLSDINSVFYILYFYAFISGACR